MFYSATPFLSNVDWLRKCANLQIIDRFGMLNRHHKSSKLCTCFYERASIFIWNAYRTVFDTLRVYGKHSTKHFSHLCGRCTLSESYGWLIEWKFEILSGQTWRSESLGLIWRSQSLRPYSHISPLSAKSHRSLDEKKNSTRLTDTNE